MRILYLILISTYFLLVYACSESTSPPPETGPDTTSHNFIWQIDTFHTNQFQSNIFWDIQAVAENNVWAVGKVYVDSTDSTGNYVEPYSAAHWDGNNWTLKRFLYKRSGDPAFVLTNIQGIWYFSDKNTWLTAGAVFHYSGGNATLSYDAWKYGPVYHLWAASENEIYAVGTKGLILKYNGTSWVKMNSGTTMDFQDIWGTVDEETGQVEVWAGAYDESKKIGIILKYDGSTWVEMFSETKQIYLPDNDHTRPTAVWVFKDSVFFAMAGYDSSKIVQHSRKEFLSFKSPHSEDRGSIQSFSGNGYNDYFAVGYRDVVLHYNGSSFKKYFDWIYIDGRFHGVQQVGNEVFICGNRFGWNTGVLLHGTRISNK